ncbi:MAG: alpha/beta fold hydrolase, partial [Deltaproteobacteria bacterium]|nr:alpha/beta fold hydrolase [Deltaproteobacteria bacterium]
MTSTMFHGLRRAARGARPPHASLRWSVRASLSRARGAVARSRVTLAVGGVQLKGALALPVAPRGLVLFAHGAGSNGRCPRHRGVARALERAGFATLLLDLLTRDEDTAEHSAMARGFDVEALAARLADAADAARARAPIGALGIGYFGAGVGAAVALTAAARRPATVRAVVSDAGRLDLVAAVLPHIVAPTLLIIDGEAATVQGRSALAQLRGECALATVPGASHLYPAPAAIDRVAALAAEWFGEHLAGRADRPSPWGPGGPAHCEEFRPGRPVRAP